MATQSSYGIRIKHQLMRHTSSGNDYHLKVRKMKNLFSVNSKHIQNAERRESAAVFSL